VCSWIDGRSGPLARLERLRVSSSRSAGKETCCPQVLPACQRPMVSPLLAIPRGWIQTGEIRSVPLPSLWWNRLNASLASQIVPDLPSVSR
jgi:hypothetical protein